MTRPDFDKAVEIGYARFLEEVGRFLDTRDVFNPDDVVHTTIMEFQVRHMAKFTFTGQAEFESYVKGMIHRALARHFEERKGALDFTRVLPPEFEEIVEERPSALDLLEQTEIKDAMPKLLSQLTDREREVALASIAGFTQKQVGTILGVSQQRVSALYQRVLEKARKFLDEGAYL